MKYYSKLRNAEELYLKLKAVLRLPKGNLSLTGFTLIELLLASCIVGIVMVCIYSSFSLGLRCWHRAKSNRDYQARKILNKLTRDLRSAYISKSDDLDFSFKGAAAAVNFITTEPLRNDLVNTKDTDLVEVRYYLEPDKDKNIRSLVSITKSIFPVDNKKEKTLLLGKDLEVLKFSYYDGQDWKPAWTSSEELPYAVKISISLKDKEYQYKPQLYSRIVNMPGRW